jgi:hypothetical protein
MRDAVDTAIEDLLYAYAIWIAEKGYVEAQVPDARETVVEFLAELHR